MQILTLQLPVRPSACKLPAGPLPAGPAGRVLPPPDAHGRPVWPDFVRLYQGRQHPVSNRRAAACTGTVQTPQSPCLCASARRPWARTSTSNQRQLMPHVRLQAAGGDRGAGHGRDLRPHRWGVGRLCCCCCCFPATGMCFWWWCCCRCCCCFPATVRLLSVVARSCTLQA